MGSAGTIWRVGDPHGEWTRRNGALDRLVMGRSGRQAYVRREAPAAGAHAGLDCDSERPGSDEGIFIRTRLVSYGTLEADLSHCRYGLWCTPG